MNNEAFTDKLIAIALGILVVCMMLFVVELGRLDYEKQNNAGVDLCAARRTQLEMQLQDIDELDNELSEVK